MQPTESRPADSDGRPGLRLFWAAAWSHRWGALSWAIAAGGFLTYFGAAYAATVKSFKGGAIAFGIAAAPAAEAMRPFSGPSERLDTYGGYVTYHNATNLAGLLAIWALIQGARAIRGWEERGILQVWLSTGITRGRVVLERWLGFIAAMGIIVLAIGLGFGAGMALAGEPNWTGSFVVAAEIGLVAVGVFGLALLVSQFTRTARAGAGITAAVVLAAYFLNNISPRLGSFGWVRFASPFFFYQQSRVLIPSHHVDPAATAVLIGFALLFVPLATALFVRREIAGPFWQRPAAEAAVRPSGRQKVRVIWTRDQWLLELRNSWVAVAGWAVGGGLLMAMLVGISGQITAVWESSELIRRMFGSTPGTTIVDRYLSYVSILAALVSVAFVISEAARWVGDLQDRRAEILVSTWGSRSRLVLEWATGLTAALVVIDLAVIAGAVAGADAFGVQLHAEGLIRLAATATLLGLGIGGIALLTVVLLRSDLAVAALATVLGAGFVVSVFGPMFSWPDWLLRLSPFRAFGAPYIEPPELWGICLLAGLAFAGTALAGVIARRKSLAS